MDLLNLAGEESIDLPDLSFALGDVPTGLLGELTDGVLQTPGSASVFSGFVPAAAASNGPVTIGASGTPNTALLSQVVAGKLVTGTLSAVGPASVAIDISNYAAGSYGIYIRFARVEAEPESRSFLSGVDQAEYSKTVNTRLSGLWQARIENPAPGPEWLRIGDAVITSAGSGQGNTVVVTDKRPLFFEGTFDQLYRPTWGTAADRTLRRTATITNFQRMFDALKQCIVDIKGPNTARWYDPYITGLNVGPGFSLTDTPASARVAVGDARFYLLGDALLPSLAFDGTADYLQLNRSTGVFSRVRGGVTNFQIGTDGRVISGSTSPLYPSAALSIQNTGSPRTAVIASAAGFGSLMVGSIAAGQGGYVGLGDAATFGGTPRWGILASTGGNGTFELQSSQGVILRCQPNSPSTSLDFTTTLFGKAVTIQSSIITLNPGANGTIQAYTAFKISDRELPYGALPWAVGNCFSDNDFPANFFTGRAIHTSRGTDGYGKYIQVSFDDGLPTNPILSAGALGQSSSQNSQLGYVCTPVNQLDGKAVRYYIRSPTGELTWGSFWFRVDYGPNS